MRPAWPEPSSDDELAMNDGVSGSSSFLLLYTILPALLSRRISKFRMLRRTFSEHQISSYHTQASSHSTIESLGTPPLAYRADMPTIIDSDDDGSTVYPPHVRRSSVKSSHPSERRSGIQWKYAEAGLSILSLATQEASLPQPAINLVRRQYISGLACMLRALPSDLTSDEDLSIREALSNVTQCGPHDERIVTRSVDTGIDGETAYPRRGSAPPSVLHYLIATLTCYAFLAISFLLPYFQLLLRQAYQYDRRHKISDRLLAKGVATADAMSRQTIVLAANVCALQDGKVGEIMREAGIYVVQSFSGGVYDGLGDGMQRVGLRNGVERNKLGRNKRLQQEW